MPNLHTDGPSFFPNVLRDVNFQKSGILFENEPAPEAGHNLLRQRLHWAVIDPRRHAMYIWQKAVDENCQDFVVTLGTSAFSNGSFNLYASKMSGSLAHATYWTCLFAFSGVLSIWGMLAVKNKWKKYIFANVTPEGFIFGDREGISERTESRPRHHYFGRKSGTEFDDYVIAKGDPPTLAEVIGGLFRILDNYQYANDDPRHETHQQNMFGYWGLAPLSSNSGIPSDELVPAIDTLSASLREQQLELGPLAGLIIVTFYGGDTEVMGGYLSRARVKDVVRIDGSDSVLFGHDTEILVGAGDDMSDYKKVYNRWGYFFLKK